jgi:branched-chain amino acid transport system permease protein
VDPNSWRDPKWSKPILVDKLVDVFIQIIASGLTLGAMYAVSTVGLSLIYGSLNMLNMAHGAMLTLGGYVCYATMARLELPAAMGFVAAILACGALGVTLYLITVRPLLRAPNFETNVFIATIGIGAIIENVVLKLFGPYPIPQPLTIPGDFVIGHVHVPRENMFILVIAVTMMAAVATMLERSQVGRAIRATAQNRSAAELMGVRVNVVYAQVLALSGGLAAVSGVLISSIATLTPVMGADPMTKAFIICVVAGLGNVYGAVASALALGLLESACQYLLGVRWSFATLLLVVVVVLIWRPYGLFGWGQEERL